MELLKELSLTHPWISWCISTIGAVLIWQLSILLIGLAFRRQPPERLVPIWTIGIIGTLVLPATRLSVSPLERPAINWISGDVGRDGTWVSAPPGAEDREVSDVSSLQTLPATEASPLVLGLLLFGLGAFVILIRLIVSAVRVHRIAGRAVPWRHTSGLVEPGTRVVVSGEVNVPFAVGILNRVIVLPEDAASKPFDELKACLIHEGTHVRRRDVLRHILGRVATALSWYSPFSWWIEKQLRLDSERVCDRQVVQSGISRQDYIRQIVQLANGSILKQSVDAAWIPSLKTSHLMLRVESLCVSPTGVSMGRHVRWCLVGCGIAFIVLLSRLTLPAPELGFIMLPEVSGVIVQP